MRSPQIESRQAVPTWQGSPASVEIVLRVRLVGGDRLDVTYEDAEAVDRDAAAEHAIAALARDTGALRTRHGDRLVVLYGRGVAALEVAPRGAVV